MKITKTPAEKYLNISFFFLIPAKFYRSKQLAEANMICCPGRL